MPRQMGDAIYKAGCVFAAVALVWVILNGSILMMGSGYPNEQKTHMLAGGVMAVAVFLVGYAARHVLSRNSASGTTRQCRACHAGTGASSNSEGNFPTD